MVQNRYGQAFSIPQLLTEWKKLDHSGFEPSTVEHMRAALFERFRDLLDSQINSTSSQTADSEATHSKAAIKPACCPSSKCPMAVCLTPDVPEPLSSVLHTALPAGPPACHLLHQCLMAVYQTPHPQVTPGFLSWAAASVASIIRSCLTPAMFQCLFRARSACLHMGDWSITGLSLLLLVWY